MGIVIFSSLQAALKEGFQVYDRTGDGYIVRKQEGDKWVMAFVQIKPVSPYERD